MTPDTGNSSPVVKLTDANIRLLRGRSVEIDYTDKRGNTTTRTVTPMHLTRVHGHPAMYAHCSLRGENRTFLLRRVERCTCADWPDIIAQNEKEQLTRLCTKLESTEKARLGLLLMVAVSIAGFTFGIYNTTSPSVSVSRYTRSDGTRVSGYSRKPPGSVRRDRPYTLIRGVSLLLLIGGGIGAWLAHQQVTSLRDDLKRLQRP